MRYPRTAARWTGSTASWAEGCSTRTPSSTTGRCSKAGYDFVDFVDFACESHQAMTTHVHQIGSMSIRVDGQTAGSECYVFARLRMKSPDGGLTDIFTHGRYVDRWERREGVWRISNRQYLHAMGEIRAVTSDGFATTGQRDSTDPSYAVLSS